MFGCVFRWVRQGEGKGLWGCGVESVGPDNRMGCCKSEGIATVGVYRAMLSTCTSKGQFILYSIPEISIPVVVDCRRSGRAGSLLTV